MGGLLLLLQPVAYSSLCRSLIFLQFGLWTATDALIYLSWSGVVSQRHPAPRPGCILYSPGFLQAQQAEEAESSLKTGSWDFKGPTEPTLLRIMHGQAPPDRWTCQSARDIPYTTTGHIVCSGETTLPPQTFCPLQTPRAADILSDSEAAPDLNPSRSKRPTTDLPVVSRWAGSLGPVARSGHLTQ